LAELKLGWSAGGKPQPKNLGGLASGFINSLLFGSWIFNKFWDYRTFQKQIWPGQVSIGAKKFWGEGFTPNLTFSREFKGELPILGRQPGNKYFHFLEEGRGYYWAGFGNSNPIQTLTFISSTPEKPEFLGPRDKFSTYRGF